MFETHIPMDRRIALAAGQALPDRCEGAALFADISEFSRLMDDLVDRLGPRLGSEQVPRIVSQVFDGLIRELHQYGGSVINFAGDAVTCWFDDRGPGPEGCATARAVHVGLAMQRAVAELAVSDSALRLNGNALALKVSVATGPARRFLVGEPRDLQLDALAGETLDRLAAADRIARPGDVIVDRLTIDALGADLRSTPTEDETYARVIDLSTAPAACAWANHRPLSDEAAAPFVRAAIREQVGVDAQLLGELRLACPVFVAIDGIEYEDDDAGAKLDVLVRWAEDAAARFGGSLHELSIGDKGTYLYVVFGAPIAHADDSRRAVAAAALLSRPPSGLGAALTTRVGVSRGRVFAGMCGGADRHCYAVMGAEVNVAARLMGFAEPGQVVASDRVATEVRETYAFSPLGRRVLKGQASPMAVHALSGERDGKRVDSGQRPVGRDVELDRLVGLLSQAESGDRQLCLIEGEVGVGKSVLVGQVIREAKELGFSCWVGAGEEISRSTPWRSWRSAILNTVGGTLIDRADLREVVRTYLESLGGEELLRRMPLLNAALPLGVKDNELTRWMNRGVRGDNTLELLLRMVKATRSPSGCEAEPARPLLVVLDDAHWADASSWRLIERAAQELEGALVLVVTRFFDDDDTYVPESCRELIGRETTTKIRLEGLEADASRAVIAQTLGAKTVPDSLFEYIEQRAEGHPFYTVELASALRDAGVVRSTGGACELVGTLDDSLFPDSIEGVITSRIDRLAPAEQELLKVGAVVGRRFEATLVRAVLPSSGTGEQVRVGLERSAELHLTLRDKSAEVVAYIFRHIVTQRVAYELLLFAQRHALHAAVAERIEERFQADLSGHYALLAHHCERAEQLERAVDYLELAGYQALELGAFRECVQFFEHAAEISPGKIDARRQARWDEALSSSWYRLGELESSRAAAERAVKSLDQVIPGGPQLGVSIVSEVIRQVGHRYFPARSYGRAPEEDRADLRSAVRLYMNLSEVYYLAGEPGPSVYTAVRLVNVAERAGPSDELVEAYGVVAIITGLVGRHAWSKRYAELAWNLADELDTPPAKAIIRHQVSLYNAAMGDFDRVHADEEEAVAIYRRLGDIGRLRDALGLYGTSEYLAGRHDNAQKQLDALIATARGDETYVQKIWAAGWLGALALRRGDLNDAERWLSESVELLDRTTVGLMEIPVVGMLALVHERSGKRDEAQTLAERAFALIEKSGGRPSGHIALDGYAAVAELYDAWGDTKRAKRAVKLLGIYCKTFPIGRPVEALYRGMQAERAGRSAAAQTAWRQGLRAAEELGMEFEIERLKERLEGSETGA